ncbi:protein of unknown function [Rhodovastum atsumiense]|nr:protein of unknown function [Rhodovastum atsumiense]
MAGGAEGGAGGAASSDMAASCRAGEPWAAIHGRISVERPWKGGRGLFRAGCPAQAGEQALQHDEDAQAAQEDAAPHQRGIHAAGGRADRDRQQQVHGQEHDQADDDGIGKFLCHRRHPSPRGVPARPGRGGGLGIGAGLGGAAFLVQPRTGRGLGLPAGLVGLDLGEHPGPGRPGGLPQCLDIGLAAGLGLAGRTGLAARAGLRRRTGLAAGSLRAGGAGLVADSGMGGAGPQGAVIGGTPLRIAENGMGFVDGLEGRFGMPVAGIAVGVQAHRQAAIGLLDRCCIGIHGNAEYIVMVHGGSLTQCICYDLAPYRGTIQLFVEHHRKV